MKIIIDDKTYTLIPLADEPKPDNKIEARLEYLEEKDKKNDMRLEALEERLDKLTLQHKLTESFASDIWQRLCHVEDGLSKRIQDLEKDTDGTVTNLFDRVNRVEYDNKESNTWGVRVNGDLHEMHNRLVKLEQLVSELAANEMAKLGQEIQPEDKQLNEGTQPSDVGAGVISSVNGAISTTNTQYISNNVTVPGNYPSSFTPTWAPANVIVSGQPSNKGVWVTREMLDDAYWWALEGDDCNETILERAAKRLGLEE